MWKVDYRKAFLKDLIKLPSDIRTKIEKIVFNELKCENPYKLGYLQKLKGYKDKYKIRIGNYRLGLTLNKSNYVIICERVADRKDIYKIFP
jgi:mRNA interferase RelE/StbE